MVHWFLVGLLAGSDPAPASGGKLSANQSLFDQLSLRLALKIDPSCRTIEGFAELELLPLQLPLDLVELELVDTLCLIRVDLEGETLPFSRRGHRLEIRLPQPRQRAFTLRIEFEGTPWTATRPPWSGGFNWSRTDGGQPWVGVSCQAEGGKLWFPCKTHPSDKFSQVKLEIQVPKPLYCVANGLLEKIEEAAEPGWRIFHWYSRYPISSYNITVNLADYDLLRTQYSGSRTMPVYFYVLKEEQDQDRLAADSRDYREKTADLLEMTREYLAFYASFYGEYPFIEEKFAIVHTAYLGMEHQTINSYGNHFQIKDGYDAILLHELGHEWWGNKVSVSDWADFWIHEGICTYATGVFLESKYGLQRAQTFFADLKRHLSNRRPLIPDRHADSTAAYHLDVYYKAALMLHSLRYLIGKPALDGVLRDLAGSAEHTYENQVNSEDFIAFCQARAGRDLGWFFETYLEQASLPRLIAERNGEKLILFWEDPNFVMPVEVAIQGRNLDRKEHCPMTSGPCTLTLKKGETYQIDPDQWVLKALVTQPDPPGEQ